MKHLIRNSKGGLSIGYGQTDDRILGLPPVPQDWVAHAKKMLADNDERRWHEPKFFTHNQIKNISTQH